MIYGGGICSFTSYLFAAAALLVTVKPVRNFPGSSYFTDTNPDDQVLIFNEPSVFNGYQRGGPF